MICMIGLTCRKNKSTKKEKPKVCQETIQFIHSKLNDSNTPIKYIFIFLIRFYSNIPEIFAGCEEIIAIMQPREYDQDLYVYYNQLCPKNDISRRMHKPQV